jgi:hypothetical protein
MSVFPTPRPRSQTTTSMTVPTIGGACIMAPPRAGVQEGEVNGKAEADSYQARVRPLYSTGGQSRG